MESQRSNLHPVLAEISDHYDENIDTLFIVKKRDPDQIVDLGEIRVDERKITRFLTDEYEAYRFRTVEGFFSKRTIQNLAIIDRQDGQTIYSGELPRFGPIEIDLRVSTNQTSKFRLSIITDSDSFFLFHAVKVLPPKSAVAAREGGSPRQRKY